MPLQKRCREIPFQISRRPFFKSLFNELYADNTNYGKKAQIFELFHFYFTQTKDWKLVLMLVFLYIFFSFQVNVCHFSFQMLCYATLNFVMTMTEHLTEHWSGVIDGKSDQTEVSILLHTGIFRFK